MKQPTVDNNATGERPFRIVGYSYSVFVNIYSGTRSQLSNWKCHNHFGMTYSSAGIPIMFVPYTSLLYKKALKIFLSTFNEVVRVVPLPFGSNNKRQSIEDINMWLQASTFFAALRDLLFDGKAENLL